VRSDILERALTPEQKQRGFSLAEDDHFLNLIFKGEVKAVFSAKGATWVAIRQTADRIAKKDEKITE